MSPIDAARFVDVAIWRQQVALRARTFANSADSKIVFSTADRNGDGYLDNSEYAHRDMSKQPMPDKPKYWSVPVDRGQYARAATRLHGPRDECGNALKIRSQPCDYESMTATLRKDFDEFLFAPVGKDADGNSVTLLTVLARLGVDPWDEAADLANLSREPAMQRLASRLEAMPNQPASAAETVSIATRLIALLHRAPVRKAASPEAPLSQKAATPSKGVNVATYWLIGLIVVLVAQWAISSQHAPARMDTTITSDSRK